MFRVKDEASENLEQFHGHLEQIEQKMGVEMPQAAAAMAIGFAGAASAVVALGAAAFELGAQFDEAFDTIRVKTVATGEVMEQLADDFKAVAAATPSSFADAATAIGLLNARTGQLGEGLQQLAEQELTLARITHADMGEQIRVTTRLFGDWGIATDDQSVVLDKLFRASQLSGGSVSQLAQTVVQFGAPMRQLGMDLDTAISLMAKWEKEGVNTETVLGTMRIALAKMAETGFDPSQTFERLVVTIRDMEDPIEATSLAMDVFGKRGGADMAAAIREGRFAIDDYKQEMEDAGGAIEDTRSKVDDAKEEMAKSFNDLKVAAEPVVTAVFEALNNVLITLKPAMHEFAQDVQNIASAMKAIGSGQVTIQELAAVALGVNTRPQGPAKPDLSGLNLQRPGFLPPLEEPAPPPGAAPGATGGGGPAPLTAAELAALRKDNEAEREAAREAARIKREQEREAAAAVREAERILKEQERQAEREAEIEARRVNMIRELEQRRQDTINEAIDNADVAIRKAQEQADEKIAIAQEEFDRQKAIEDQRKQLQKDVEAATTGVRDRQAANQRSTADDRSAEDRRIRREREDADFAARISQQSGRNDTQERQSVDAINAARQKGDVLTANRLQLQLEQTRKNTTDQLAVEAAAMQLRRDREDEDFARQQARRAEDLATQKANAAELLNDPVIKAAQDALELFNNTVAQDTLDRKILDYIKARDELIGTANQRIEDTTTRANEQFDVGVERANQSGLTQQVILNNYNSGFQGPDIVDEMVNDLLDEAASRLSMSG